MFVPVVLTEVDTRSQQLFERAIRALRLTVCLRMIRSTHRERRTELRPERVPEVSRESRIAITQNRVGYAMQTNDLTHEDRRQLRCSDIRRRGDVVHHLRQLIN